MGLAKKIDSSISIAIRNDKITTRPSVSPGCWIVALLPVATILTAVVHPVSEIYQCCAVYSVNLLLNSVLLLYHIKSYGSVAVLKGIDFYCIIPVLISTPLFMYTDTKLGFYRSLCHSFANGLIYLETIPYVLKTFPRSFSFGEACVVGQAVSLFVYGTFLRLVRSLINPLSDDLEIITTLVQVTLTWTLLICLIPRSWSASRQYAAIAFLLTSLVPILNALLGLNAIYWVLEFLYKLDRLRLICGWAVLSGFAWGMVVAQIRSHRKAATDTRKVFHLLAVVVFVSGVISDPVLLFLAAGLVFPLFLLIELVRVRKLPPFANALQQGFLVYADEKDAGGVALTPIYLLIGCSLPMWLLPEVQGPDYVLPLLSGVLSIGIGDSCASVVGKNFGRQKWSGSNKTVEGSVACAAGQVTALLVLASLGHIPTISISAYHLARPIIGVCIVSLVEAKTDQIDNLVLPLLCYILLVS